MSVEIDPLELSFRRPFTVEISQTLKIRNPNNAPVAFKVKTTAPKQYCVRPNSGRIEPGHEVEVSVLLQSMKQEPPPDAKCRDKFLVQSVLITADKEFTNVTQIWDSVEKSAIQEKKIRVTWLSPLESYQKGQAVTPVPQRVAANGLDATPDSAPPAYSSPQADSSTLLHDDTTTTTYHHDEPREQHYQAEPETAPATQQPVAAAAAAASSVAATVKTAAAETYEELKDKLAQAEAMVAQLSKEAASGLRQRKVAASGDETADAAAGQPGQQQVATAAPRATEGVPVQIVALLCLVSFLLAYLFF